MHGTADEHRRIEAVSSSAASRRAQAARTVIRCIAAIDSHPACSSREYTPAQVEFGRAMEKWKRFHGGRTPTAVEVLRIAKSLGYERTEGG